MYKAYVTTLKNVRPHSNADRLQLADCFGNTVCVGLEYKEGDVGVYFPVDGQLSEEFCKVHDLVRRKDENGNAAGGYLDPKKRNITAIKLRGEKSDGLFMPISCLDYCFDVAVAEDVLNVGDTVDIVNSHLICEKYIPYKAPKTSAGGAGTRAHRRAKRALAPTFFEHADTEQLVYNLADFKPGDYVDISLKMHGTSQRTGYLKVFQGYADSFPCRVGNAIRKVMARLGGKNEEDIDFHHDGKEIYDRGYVSGTRRVVLDTFDGGFYGSNAFREPHAKKFEGKLWKGETVYYEVVGFTDTGAPIMGSCGNEKLGKDFVKQYGKETVFSYGCEPDGCKFYNKAAEDLVAKLNEHAEEKLLPQSDIYVYRMTMTNEDGNVVEYTPDFMRYRCELMGVKCVPSLWSGFIPQNPASKDDPTITAGEWIQNKAELYYDGPDPVGKTHVREGVVVRIINRPKFAAYKHKNFDFKVLSGIAMAKTEAEGADVSEDILAEM